MNEINISPDVTKKLQIEISENRKTKKNDIQKQTKTLRILVQKFIIAFNIIVLKYSSLNALIIPLIVSIIMSFLVFIIDRFYSIADLEQLAEKRSFFSHHQVKSSRIE